MTHKSAKNKGSRNAEGTVNVTICLPHGVVERLDVLAKEQRRSRSNAALLLIERALDAAKQAQVG